MLHIFAVDVNRCIPNVLCEEMILFSVSKKFYPCIRNPKIENENGILARKIGTV